MWSFGGAYSPDAMDFKGVWQLGVLAAVMRLLKRGVKVNLQNAWRGGGAGETDAGRAKR
jgi:hypothetical protein